MTDVARPPVHCVVVMTVCERFGFVSFPAALRRRVSHGGVLFGAVQSVYVGSLATQGHAAGSAIT